MLRSREFTTTSQVSKNSFLSAARPVKMKMPVLGPSDLNNPELTFMASNNLPSSCGRLQDQKSLFNPCSMGTTVNYSQKAADKGSSKSTHLNDLHNQPPSYLHLSTNCPNFSPSNTVAGPSKKKSPNVIGTPTQRNIAARMSNPRLHLC